MRRRKLLGNRGRAIRHAPYHPNVSTHGPASIQCCSRQPRWDWFLSPNPNPAANRVRNATLCGYDVSHLEKAVQPRQALCDADDAPIQAGGQLHLRFAAAQENHDHRPDRCCGFFSDRANARILVAAFFGVWPRCRRTGGVFLGGFTGLVVRFSGSGKWPGLCRTGCGIVCQSGADRIAVVLRGFFTSASEFGVTAPVRSTVALRLQRRYGSRPSI